MSELGDILRDARTVKGISVAEAEEATKIRQKYLQAIEESNYDVLPPSIYTRGFIRNYAIFLGLDPTELTSTYRNGSEPYDELSDPRIISEPLQPRPLISLELIAGIALLSVLSILLVFVYRRYLAPLAAFPGAPTPTVAQALGLGNSVAEAPAIVANLTPTPMPTEVPPPAPTNPPPTADATIDVTPAPVANSNSKQEVALDFAATEDTWLRVTLDGETAFEGILKSGDQASWVADREIVLRTGNAGGSIASVNGADLGLLGESGEVLNFIWLLAEDGSVLTNPPAP